jgi:ABC-type dipeptide/oligopeptide/nickel transport system ATPase component
METRTYEGTFSEDIKIIFVDNGNTKKLSLNVNDTDVQSVILDKQAHQLTARNEKVKMLFRKLSELPGLPIAANEITPDKMENALNEIALAADTELLDEQDKLQAMYEAEEESMRDEAATGSTEYLLLLEELGMTPIQHLVNLSGWLAANEDKNIAAGVLALTSTIWHFLPIWVQIIGAAGSGKSIIEESVNKILPKVKRLEGESTRPALFSMLDADPWWLDGKYFSLGDQGSEKDLERNMDLFDLAKRLYTDTAGATRRKMERLDKNGPMELIIQEIKGHCSVLFTLVHELTDTQHVSRIISINPLDDGESYDRYCMYLDTHTRMKVKRDEIIKEVKLVSDMILHYSYMYKDFQISIINPYTKIIINWTNNLPNTKRVREQVNALLKVIVLFNNNEKQRYVLEDGRIVYIVSKIDILTLNELFSMNIGVSVEAMNFYKWIKGKNRNGELRVKPLDDDEYEDASIDQKFKSRFLSLFTVRSIREKVNPKMRHFDRKAIPDYCTQLADVGLIKVITNDKDSKERIMGLSNYGEKVTGNIPFKDKDVWDYVDKFLDDHAWLDEPGFKWMHDFILEDIAIPENEFSIIAPSADRKIPWVGAT